jgi:hypothetical protein
MSCVGQRPGSPVKEYAEVCRDFHFYYPNGIPDDAKRCCLECINLDESKLSKEAHEKHDYHCQLQERETKKKIFQDCFLQGQRRLF